MRRRLLVALAAVIGVAAVIAIATRRRGAEVEGGDAPSSATEGRSEASLIGTEATRALGEAKPAAPDEAPGAKAGEVVGIVTGPPGYDVRKALAYVSPVDKTRWWWGGAQASVDARGVFRMPWRRDDDEVFVQVQSRDVDVLGASARTRSGAPPLRLTLPHAAPPVSVTVVDPTGAPMRGVRVAIEARADEWFLAHESAATSGADGRVRLVPPPEGLAAVVVATAPRDRDDVAESFTEAYAPGLESIRFPAASHVEGVVRDHLGQPLADAFVVWRQGEGPWNGAKVQYDATFEVTRLPPGAVTFAVLADPPEWHNRMPWEPDDGRPQGLVIPEGTATRVVGTAGASLVLTLDMGESLEVRIDGWPREAGRPAFLTREGDGTPGRPRRIRAEVSVDGVARFRRLAPDARYAFWAPPAERTPFGEEPDERCAYRRGLRSSDSPATVESAVGKSLDVRVIRPDGKPLESASPPSIDDRGVVAVADSTDVVGGRYRFRGLPDGEWTVKVAEVLLEAPAKEEEVKFEDWSCEVRAAAGASVDAKLAFVGAHATR